MPSVDHTVELVKCQVAGVAADFSGIAWSKVQSNPPTEKRTYRNTVVYTRYLQQYSPFHP
jgi:hypothetical protein